MPLRHGPRYHQLEQAGVQHAPLLAFAALPSGGGVSDVWLYSLADGAVSRATQNADSRYPVFISDR